MSGTDDREQTDVVIQCSISFLVTRVNRDSWDFMPDLFRIQTLGSGPIASAVVYFTHRMLVENSCNSTDLMVGKPDAQRVRNRGHGFENSEHLNPGDCIFSCVCSCRIAEQRNTLSRKERSAIFDIPELRDTCDWLASL